MRPVDEETAETIRDHYAHGRGSIQDYARIYHLDVNQVLEIIGEEDLGTVEIGGDLVDAKELGKNGASQINGPEEIDVPFTLN